MSDNNEDGGENTSRGNEWEVVSLTESAYAAAPGPQDAESKDDEKTDIPLEGAETSRALFMSSHFVFPPSQHENLPLEPESSDDDVAAEFAPNEAEAAEEEEVVEEEEEENTLEGSKDSDESPEIKSSDDKGTEFEETSFADEPSLGGSKIVESLEEDFDAGDIVRSPRLSKGDGHGEEGSGLPCGAWWKRGAASLYSHAKEANTFWSIFIAAAVMGLVILGQHWQQERWQTLQLKWQFNSEKTSRIFGPISRLKDVIVGGHRRGSLIRGSSSREN